MTSVLASVEGDNWLELTTEPLPPERALTWVERPSCGAVACFVGTVRDHAQGRTGVQAIDYEAYTQQVLPRFEAIVAAAREPTTNAFMPLVTRASKGMIASAMPSDPRTRDDPPIPLPETDATWTTVLQ